MPNDEVMKGVPMARLQERFSAVLLALAAVFFLLGISWRGLAQSGAGMQLPPADADSIVAMSPYFDTHAHFDSKIVSDSNSEVDSALREMGRENAARLIFLPSPFLPDDPNRFDHDAFMAAVKKHRDRLAFQGGGGSLNLMIQESVRSSDAGPEIQRKFKERAEQIIRDGAVGFGELSSEHLSFLPEQAYETAPPDHPLFLLLADIAAEHGIPIDLHLDAAPRTIPLPPDLKSPPNPAKIQENLSAFERLLSHNPRAKIVWAHAGWDNIGNRTPDLCRRLLQAHPNLYMEIKIDPLDLGKNPPITNGEIKPEWLRLFQDFPDRFVIGTDQHYNSERPMTGPQRWKMAVLLLNQLPGDLRRKIGVENALHIFPIPKNL
jgi:predicted TIM-barrel fold metal-dependent hydrolase